MLLIYVYNIMLKNDMRDDLLKSFKLLDKNIYDLRIGKNHVEIASYDYINRVVADLFSRSYKVINVDNFRNDKNFSDGLELMNNGMYWLAHEVLENIWRDSYGIEKETLRFLILICAANVHNQRGHQETAKNVVSRALKIKTLNEYNGLNISLLRQRLINNEWINIDNL